MNENINENDDYEFDPEFEKASNNHSMQVHLKHLILELDDDYVGFTNLVVIPKLVREGNIPDLTAFKQYGIEATRPLVTEELQTLYLDHCKRVGAYPGMFLEQDYYLEVLSWFLYRRRLEEEAEANEWYF